MTTGPIERYPHFRPQIHKSRRFSYTRCAGGAFRMLWGYTKKMVLADNMNLYIKMVYDTPAEMNGPNLVAATLLFSLRLYLDFFRLLRYRHRCCPHFWGMTCWKTFTARSRLPALPSCGSAGT